MGRLTILMGAPGSGKSTWATSRAGRGEVVSTEGARVDPSAGGEVMSGAYRRIKELLDNDEHVIFDTCAASPGARKAALRIAREHGAEVDVTVFDTPVEDCLEAQRTREHPVPDETVRRYHADIHRQIPELASEGFRRIKIIRRARRA
jgi:predicted kinase